MKLIVGLGNPGVAYLNTRHNSGFLVVDALLKQIQNKSKVLIFKSQNFMNESGIFVKKLVDQYKIEPNDLFIIHDDLDIRLGEYKIQFGRGPKDHNGIASVNDALDTEEYWHVRIGVDNRPLDNRPLGVEYVLEKFSDSEKVVLEKVVEEVAGELVKKIKAP